MSYLSTVLNAKGDQAKAFALSSTTKAGLSYEGLAGLINDVKKGLTAASIGANDRIALVTPNGPVAASSFLALSSATAVAPLNPAYRSKEMAFYLADLQPVAVVVHSQLDSPVRVEATKLGIPVIELEEDLSTPGNFSLGHIAKHDRATIAAGNDEIGLILHTSGTTSRPKMVPLTRSNLSHSAINIIQTLKLTKADRCLNIMPLFHIHGLVAAVLATFESGGSLACAAKLDANALLDKWLPNLAPSWYTAVPTMHQNILAASTGRETELKNTNLRFIRSSSASLPPTVLHELERVFNVPVIEAYGMTEASHQMASNPLPPLSRKPGSVGLAAGPRITILDQSDNVELTQGATGEIAICGDNVTSGYLANSEATEQAFAGNWFRTGDQGHLDADGYLYITGRLKEIINRGGEKISPREVDEAALEIDGVDQAIAFAVPHPQLGEDLCLAVVKSDAMVTSQFIRARLFELLADFKVPSRVIFLNEIPKSATGKVQRVNLADTLSKHLKVTYVAPKNELEQLLVEVFEEILNTSQIGVNDNFFSAGGDSLQGTRLAARLSDIFEVSLANTMVFQAPTPAELAEHIEQKMLLDNPENAKVIQALKTTTLQELDQSTLRA